MHNDEEDTLPAGWVAQRLAALRQRLDNAGDWPEKANQLWLDLAQHAPAPLDEEDEVLLSIVVSDAGQGVDISRRYPDFYRKMLGNPRLFQAFVALVELMEAEQAGTLEEASPADFELPDPSQVMPIPTVKEPAAGRWSVIWRQTTERLEKIFNLSGPALSPVYRSGRGILEESSATLIRGQAVVAGQSFGVLLTAGLAGRPDTLELQMLVADLGWSNAGFSAGSLQANLRWGRYDETGVVDEDGQIDLPPLPLEAVLDESGQSLVGDLQLRLEPVPQ